jgi:hypothetical protein
MKGGATDLADSRKIPTVTERCLKNYKFTLHAAMAQYIELAVGLLTSTL